MADGELGFPPRLYAGPVCDNSGTEAASVAIVALMNLTLPTSTALCSVQPRPQPKPALTDFGLQPYAVRSPTLLFLMVSTTEIDVNTS